MSGRFYLDHAAGVPLVRQAREAMDEVWQLPGNPSSLHTAGRAARRRLEERLQEPELRMAGYFLADSELADVSRELRHDGRISLCLRLLALTIKE